MIDKRKHIPFYIQLKDIIIDKIKSGEYDINDKIPTEKQFMEIYNVGRATVRQALSILVTEGYLYKKQGVGTFVARKQPSLGFEPLISLTYSLSVRGITPKNIIEQKKIITPDKDLLKQIKWNKRRKCFYLKRIRYGENIPIAIEDSYFNEQFCNISSQYDLMGSLAKIIVEDLKANITKVEQVIVPRLPDDYEKEKLMLEDNLLVMELKRWIYLDNSNEPYYYLKFIIPGNIYSI